MIIDLALVVLLPLVGTTLGAACVFFMGGEMDRRLRSAMLGFAAGIMVAASVWSLLLPAIERGAAWGRLAFVPATIGLLLGSLFMLLLDAALPILRAQEGTPTPLIVAVTLHNLPEGMAVGAVLAGLLAGETGITAASALALSLGIAVQNFPEGAIVSMPCRGNGASRGRAFSVGALSGAVEPIGAIVTALAAHVMVPVLPYLLGFAAGTMLYVVAEELLPEVAESGHPLVGNAAFSVGFALMMMLDVALG